MRMRARLLPLAAFALAAGCAFAQAPELVAAGPRSAECSRGVAVPRAPLTFEAVMQRVLCRHAIFGQAVLMVDEQRAALSLAELAWWPRFYASAELAERRIPQSNSSVGAPTRSVTGALGMSWVLLDAGQRDAGLRQARARVEGALAGSEAAALTAMNDALRLFVEAAIARSRLAAAKSTEDVARRSFEVAQGRRALQAASLGEQLQAQTALAQATLERRRAEGLWLTARGLLARAMDLPMDQPIELAPTSEAFPKAPQQEPVTTAEWIQRMRSDHPRIRAMRGEVNAAEARVEAAQASNGITLTLSTSIAATREFPGGEGFDRSLGGSLYVTVPLFNGADLRARVAQAEAQLENRRLALEATEREVDADLWRAARALETEAANHGAAVELAQTARESHEVALGRYKAGVGSILELLAAQTALSGAQVQLALADLALAQARFSLEVAAGRLRIAP